jgi:hypothetical protein
MCYKVGGQILLPLIFYQKYITDSMLFCEINGGQLTPLMECASDPPLFPRERYKFQITGTCSVLNILTKAIILGWGSFTTI